MKTSNKEKYPPNRIRGLKSGSQPMYSQAKTESFTTKLTPEGKEGFDRVAKELGLSKSEIIEKLARGELLLIWKSEVQLSDNLEVS
ncbi:MAG: hypothetical protein N5P05_004314 (plasmid) [Chroococcopsis gigantea SAG 12.99]|jgi:hypothetical protein|nr:hypothetical protein [Chroococcopsis gigantea SAG 12.99]